LALVVLLVGLAAYAAPRWLATSWPGEPPIAADARTRLGINLFGLANYNRQQVFTNMINQSEWFSSEGQGWSAMPADQLDARGWVRQLKSGQTAPRPLVLPPAPYRSTAVICTFEGRGTITSGGVARIVAQRDQRIDIMLDPTGAEDEGAWIELVATSPANPIRDIDCRETGRPRAERFHPEFLAFVRDFRILRFLDWQRTNDNARVRWADRSLPEDSSQVASAGASIEDMVDLANLVGADPWFLVPYQADPDYIREFARLVHRRIDPRRTVYVELGNEVWNDMFAAAQQAQQEGMTLRLGNGDPTRAQSIRYAQKLRTTMRIWTGVFADRPARLIRVAASQNANPDLAEIILSHADTADWVDALATAPYVWLDLSARGAGDTEWVFARMPRAIEETIDFAARNRAVAARHGKRFIAYEGGQHLVTTDMALARAIQRDPRMGDVYRRYLDRWNARIRSDLTLYASTAPIGEYGSWGLREYAGQPGSETPKLAAVRQFIAEQR
jgi:hypothetical protein